MRCAGPSPGPGGLPLERGLGMRRLGTVLVLVLIVGVGVMAAGAAMAGPKEATETPQVPELTSGQIVLDCAISGVALSAATTFGWFKPMTVAFGTLPVLAVMHEAVYGCGIGVISGYVGQTLVSLLLPTPTPQNPFGDESAALPTTTTQR